MEPWHWPTDRRTEPNTRVAVADQRLLLVSSADLTQWESVRTSKRAC